MKHLPPAYFALVMATGIVSIAALDFDLPLLAEGLFGLNLIAYTMLACLTGWRAWRHPNHFFADMIDHRVGTGFFTTVAATGILGAQVLLIADSVTGAIWFLTLTVALWIGLTYAIFAAFTIRGDKPVLEQGISGAWLIAVVATQSVAILASAVAGHVPQPARLELNFFALAMWTWGGMFYIWIISLIFYRFNFFVVAPSDVTPPYWINMGAMAISALAGAKLIDNAPDAPFLASLLPFLKGFTVFYWASGTWWIPMLLILTVWRHVIHRHRPRYDPLWWGAVFPLGMYAEATRQLAATLDLPFLVSLSQAAFVAALAAWTVAGTGLLRALLPRRHHDAPSG